MHLHVEKEKVFGVSKTLGQTGPARLMRIRTSLACCSAARLLGQVSHLNVALPLCSLQQEATAGPAGQEERREVGQKNALQEPPLPPAGKKKKKERAINQIRTP